MEEWRYKALDEFGGDVTVNFDPSSLFSCSWRGGKYRIESPAPVQRFEGVSSVAAARRPFALTYPNHYVYLSFPIDKEATAINGKFADAVTTVRSTRSQAHRRAAG